MSDEMFYDKKTIETEIIHELKCIQHLLRLYDADCSSLSMYISDESIRANNPYWESNLKPIDVAYFNDERGIIHYDHSNQQI